LESPTPTELRERLMAAYQCCSSCGDKYGTYRAGSGANWNDTCDVCGVETTVTQARYYGYLYKGLRLLENFPNG
jgi:formylglycine-generating enzyme required for sulfatase activity